MGIGQETEILNVLSSDAELTLVFEPESMERLFHMAAGAVDEASMVLRIHTEETLVEKINMDLKTPMEVVEMDEEVSMV